MFLEAEGYSALPEVDLLTVICQSGNKEEMNISPVPEPQRSVTVTATPWRCVDLNLM